jgi:hypothetical protein
MLRPRSDKMSEPRQSGGDDSGKAYWRDLFSQDPMSPNATPHTTTATGIPSITAPNLCRSVIANQLLAEPSLTFR